MPDTPNELTPKEIESRRRNAKKSTGPRSQAGKRRAALNALKHGIYCQEGSLEETMAEMGEDPREFQRLRADLRAALEPADAVETMLTEDIATLAWKKRRLDRAQAGLQAHNLETLELERHRRALELGRDTPLISQAEVLKTGLRRCGKSPARYGELLSYLHAVEEVVDQKDFSQDLDPVFRAIYGEEPTLRGAEIINLYQQFQDGDGNDSPQQQEEEDEMFLVGLRMAIQEEIRDVVEEYMLYLRENVDISPALQNATLAPSNPAWQAMIRHEYTLDRLIERKLRLLADLQKTRLARRGDRLIGKKNAQELKNHFCRNEASHLVETTGRH